MSIADIILAMAMSGKGGNTNQPLFVHLHHTGGLIYESDIQFKDLYSAVSQDREIVVISDLGERWYVNDAKQNDNNKYVISIFCSGGSGVVTIYAIANTATSTDYAEFRDGGV